MVQIPPLSNGFSSVSSVSTPSSGEHFKNLMNDQTQGHKEISPFELTSDAHPIGPVSYAQLSQQTNTIHTQLSQMQTQLSYPNLQINPNHAQLINNKLHETHELISFVSNKMGLPSSEFSKNHEGGILDKFLNMVADGQSQMKAAKLQLEHMQTQEGSLDPSQMMLIQLKLNKAQQLLEFSSIALSNSISGFKTLMQIQL
ncbi:MAG: hypothetical protein ACOVOR_01990 [Rhabdochlamydiaceae bacterium]